MLLKKVVDYISENAPYVKSEHAKEWAQTVIDNIVRSKKLYQFEDISAEELERKVMWHCRRLTSFGGSDAAVLYMSHVGKSLPFSDSSTDADIIRQKLCLDAPSIDTGATSRGNLFEGHLRALYEKKLQLDYPGSVRYKKAYELIAKYREQRKKSGEHFIGLDGQPDDIFITPSSRVILIDYKFPGDPDKAEKDARNPPLYNVAQLHSYKKLLELAGVDVSKCSMYNANFNSKDMTLNMGFVRHQPEIYDVLEEIVETNAKHVLSSYIPSYKPTKEFKRVEEMPEDLKAAVTRYAIVKRAASKFDKLSKEAKANLEYQMELNGLSASKEKAQKIQLPLLSSSSGTRTSLNTNLILEEFEKLGGNASDPRFQVQSATSTIRLSNSKKSPYVKMYDKIDSCIDVYSGEIEEDAIDLASGDLEPAQIEDQLDVSNV